MTLVSNFLQSHVTLTFWSCYVIAKVQFKNATLKKPQFPFQNLGLGALSNNCLQTHTVRNLHFLSKNSTLISREKLTNCFGWKCCGFGLFSCWQLWFHEKNSQKKFEWKTRENVGDLHFLVVDNFDFPRKIDELFWVKNLWKCYGFGLFSCWQL